ncbi:unnamed protein product, partial [Strongylus vulgaris]
MEKEHPVDMGVDQEVQIATPRAKVRFRVKLEKNICDRVERRKVVYDG